jgi:hypothetical protein
VIFQKLFEHPGLSRLSYQIIPAANPLHFRTRLCLRACVVTPTGLTSTQAVLASLQEP